MKQLPAEMRDWYFPFNWNLERLWALEVPVEEKPMSELEWHFDIPIWSSVKGKMLFDLRPSVVLENPGMYLRHDRRIEATDISFPIDMMYTVDRHAIIDGVHRLAKCARLGLKNVKLRVIPRGYIALFAEEA
ncbi:hypothetical protein ACFL1X_10810 [Candidatus Hydrogenedentota bacterium]